MQALKAFLSKPRLAQYEKRNDPTLPNALSGLSPWLHFGQLAPQRAALEATKVKATAKVGGRWLRGGEAAGLWDLKCGV